MLFSEKTRVTDLPTRLLMKMREALLKSNIDMEFARVTLHKIVHKMPECDKIHGPMPCWNYEQVKTELGMREHVPNAVEAKEIRRAKAHAARHR
jgi:hypothetical protein